MSKNNSTGESRLLLCTDMDRTIIPNGAQSEHSLARRQFNEIGRARGGKECRSRWSPYH